MLLAEITINAVMHRVSNQPVSLVNYWDNYILTVSPPKYSCTEITGGYCRPSFGSLSFDPTLFSSDWPPPTEIGVVIKHTESTEAAATTIFSGTGQIESFDRASIGYDLYSGDYGTVLSSGSAFDDTLGNVFSWACDPARLNLTLNTTYARVISPEVTYTTTSDMLLTDFLNDVSAFFSHFFYISGSTLYLVDMLLDNTTKTLTEFDFFKASYECRPPIAIATTDSFYVTSSYTYGDTENYEAYHDTQANVEAALTDIITISNRKRVIVPIPFSASLPIPGQKISFTDSSLYISTGVEMWVRALTYDFDNDKIFIEGDAILT